MVGNLYFRDRDGNKTLISSGVPRGELKGAIEYLANTNRGTPHYWRSWGHPAERMTYDFGSHSEFFIWEVIEND